MYRLRKPLEVRPAHIHEEFLVFDVWYDICDMIASTIPGTTCCSCFRPVASCIPGTRHESTSVRSHYIATNKPQARCFSRGVEKNTTKPQSGTGATWGGCTGATGDKNDLPGIERVTIVGKSDFVRNLKMFQEVWYVLVKRTYVYTIRIPVFE